MHGPRADIQPGQQSGREFSRRALGLLFVVVMAAISIPIVTHRLPPLSDYFNHLATAHVVDVIGRDPDLSRFYRIEWDIIPNLMIDLVVPVLHRFMDIYVAGQIFMVMIFAGILSGTMGLGRALHGRWSATPLIASPLLYNGVLLVGVMNYLAGIGIALWSVAAWIAMRERAWLLRLAVSTLLVLVLFVCHLFALGVYGLGLLAFESLRLWERRREPLGPRFVDFVATGVPFLPALVLLLISPTWDAAGVPPFWEFPGKIDGLMLVVDIYQRAVAWGILAVIGVAAAWAARRHLLAFHPFGWAVLAVGAVVYLALPRALFAAHLADQRLPIALAFMLAACFRLDLAAARVRQVFVAVLAVVLTARVAEVQIEWNSLSRGPAEVLRSVALIGRGARVLVVDGDRSRTGLISDLGLMHAASLATIERSALVSTAFTVEGKHILQVREEFRPFVDTVNNMPPSIPYFIDAAKGPGPYYFNDWPHHFDFVYLMFTRHGDPDPDPAHLALLDDADNFQLYRVIAPP
jgi:hypothetical protein